MRMQRWSAGEVRRSIFIEIPRDAAWNWAHEYTTFLVSPGSQVGRASPCNFAHQARRVHLTVHGSDFSVVASAKQMAWLEEAMKKEI